MNQHLPTTAQTFEQACVFALVELSALLIHEQVEPDRLQRLTAEIVSDGEVREPVLIDRHTMVILDGHHRVQVLRNLGCKLAPAYLIDYASPLVNVTSRRSDMVVTKDCVVTRGRTEVPFPPRTSRHDILMALPVRPVDLNLLG